jgi:hypothetical protein
VESHPGKISAKPVETIEIMRIKFYKRAVEPAMGDYLDKYLRWNQDKYAKNERDEQPLESFRKKFARAPEAQRKSRALARQNKKYGHDPLNQDAHENGKTKTQLRIFDMPAIMVEISGTVKKEDRKHGEDPQPVDIVPSFRRIHPLYFSSFGFYDKLCGINWQKEIIKGSSNGFQQN